MTARRPSIYNTQEEDVILLQTPSVGGGSSTAQRGVSIDWSRPPQTPRQSIGFDANGEQILSSPEQKYNGEPYIKLDMDDVPRTIDLARLKIKRSSRKTWERVLAIALITVLLVLLLGGQGKAKDVVRKTKMKAARTGKKNPLRSSIPLSNFRANLRDDVGYVTSFPYGGLTNQLIELFKLVHLGQRLDRTAVLTELKAVHSEGGDLPLSTFFDLPSFSYHSNVSMVEWQDVKMPDRPGTQAEILACWGWRDESPLARYNIKAWFWPPPGQLTVPSSIETSMTFPAIEVLVSQPQGQWLEETAKRYFGSVENAPPMPDQQMLCFENLFYVPSTRFVGGAVDKTYTIEEMSPDDPVWKQVGVHLHFNSHIDHIADELLLALMGTKSRQPFIGVHLRQGDFVDLGRIGKEVVDAYVAGVKEVQEKLREKAHGTSWRKAMGGKPGKGGKDLPVLFATDSEDPAFVRKLTRLGWIGVNHQEFATVARFGGWYPGLLDSVILSRAKGFVGTKMSTFSYVAARRVEAWNDGVTTIVG